jgi:hypothetical protein
MQREVTCLAEDSCFQKNHSHINDVPKSVSSETHDVEKAAIRTLDSTTTAKAVVETQHNANLNEKGVFEDNNEPHTDSSSLTADEEKDDFPEGGLRGWLVVAGAFCGSFSVFGIINSTAILLEYFSTHQLKDKDPSQIGWIFGLALFLTFFCGAPIGPIFDAYGPRALIFCGSILLVASMFLLGLCTRMWPFNSSGGRLLTSSRILALHHGLQCSQWNWRLSHRHSLYCLSRPFLPGETR